MQKICKACGSKYEGASNSKYCSNLCSSKAHRMKYHKGLSKFKDLKKCPLLAKCRAISGINCEGKDFQKCDLLRSVLLEKRKAKHD